MFVELLLDFALNTISAWGFLGIFFLMLLESTVFPIPSELVMPFAGFLIAEGKMEFFTVVFIATLGSIAGSLISYFIGKTVGKKAVIKFGKYFLLNESHLEKAHKWFENYGGRIVFVCRFIPAVRHVISIPAGIAEMNLGKFIAFTAIGAFFWNAFLAWVGIQLGKNWVVISQYTGILDLLVIAAIIALLVFYLKKKPKRKKSAV